MENKHRIITKASFRGNPVSERKLFPQSSCLMPISVGQSVHEGEKFSAVIKLVNASFLSCTILVDDTVQRHTLAITDNTECQDLHSKALELGDQWIARNHSTYTQLDIPYQILRWDHWLEHLDYETQFAKVMCLYENNQQYREAIHANVHEFLSRNTARNMTLSVGMDQAFELCINYLLEECTVMCLWVHGAYDFELYPSGRNQAMKATFDLLIQPFFPHYLRSVAIRFKKYLRANIESSVVVAAKEFV